MMSESPRIPFKLHLIWVTFKGHPVEMIDHLRANGELESFLENKKVFERSGGDWEFNVWVQDKSIIPRSISFLEENGFTVREVSELPSFAYYFSSWHNETGDPSFSEAV
mgnify:CR=1 FL=1